MPLSNPDTPPDRLPGGHTNATSSDGSMVTKCFLGPQATRRAQTEIRALRLAAGTVPVPTVESATRDAFVSKMLPGRHGQALIEASTAPAMLHEAGRVLRKIHSIPLRHSSPHSADTLIHGDYGPQNLLFNKRTLTITAVLDWEWSHIGRPIEDLAWCEWIVRMHHPDCTDALKHLYDGYGTTTPPWAARQLAMVSKCRSMRLFALESRDGTASLWERRVAITSAWLDVAP